MKARYLPRPVVLALMRLIALTALNARVPLARARRLLDAFAGLAPLPDGTAIQPVGLGDRPADRITVGGSDAPRAILYLHGGAWVTGSPRSHRSLTAHLARDAAAVVFSLDYRLAPEHPFPAALDDAEAAFRDLVSHGWLPSQVAIAGDSAGGGLAVALAQRLVASGVRPAALGLISPAVDPVHLNTLPRRRDPVVRPRWARESARMYRGAAPFDAPGLAPVHDPLDRLPPTFIHAVPQEGLYPQISAFARRVANAGVPVQLVDLPGLWHVVHSSASVLREADDAVEQLGTWLRREIDRASRRRAA